MLVLSRRPGEAVMIGEDVTIVILGIKGRHVRVGIQAPRCINVYREEICPSPPRDQEITTSTVVATAAL